MSTIGTYRRRCHCHLRVPPIGVYWYPHWENRVSSEIKIANGEIRNTCIRGDQISHIQSMVAKRGLTNWANVHTPVETQHGRNPLDPAILAATGHRFIAKTNKKSKNATRTETRDQTLLGA